MRVYVSQFVGGLSLQSLPLAAGMLVASANKTAIAERVTFEIVTARSAPDETVGGYLAPDILAFSCYTWNERYTLEVIRRARARFPGALVVMGGPSVPRRPASIARYFEAHEGIDVLALGEGEESFGELIEARLEGRPLSEVPGLALRVANSAPTLTSPRPRMRDFSHTGSPYLSGLFDEMVKDHVPPINAALIETNRGCPFSCTFCDWGQATQSRVYELPEARVREELRWVAAHEIPFVYIIDANFGIRKRDLQIIEQLIEIKRETGFPTSCYFHLTKNARVKNLRTVMRLQEAGIDCRMALSMQDFDPRVLKAIKRANIRSEQALQLRELCHEKGIPTFNKLLLGLPEQTYASFSNNLMQAMTPYARDTFNLYLCRLLENAEMASPEHREAFGIQTVVGRSGSPVPGYQAFVDEVEEIVVATSAMSNDEWRRAYRLGYFVSTCYNHDLLRAELCELQFHRGVDMTGLFDALVDALLSAPPDSALSQMNAIFDRYLDAIMRGDAMLLPLEHLGSHRWTIEEALKLVGAAHQEALRSEVQGVVDVFVG